MSRKVWASLGIGGIVVVLVVGLAWMRWATQQAPDFYETAMQASPPPAERVEAAREFAEQTAQLVHEMKYSRAWQQEFTQARVNAWLAEEVPEQYARRIPRGVTDPRVQFAEGVVWFGFRFSNSKFNGIVSLAVRPEVTEPNRIALHVESLSAGVLPLVPTAFIDDVSKQLDRYGVEHEWEVAEGKPVLHLELDSPGGDAPVLEEVEVEPERLRIAGYREAPRALTMTSSTARRL